MVGTSTITVSVGAKSQWMQTIFTNKVIKQTYHNHIFLSPLRNQMEKILANSEELLRMIPCKVKVFTATEKVLA